MSTNKRLSLVRVKIDWAKHHLDELERGKQRFMDGNPYGTGFETDLETNQHLFKMLYVEPIPLEIALIAGDVIHSTRSALDHLAWQLVLANGQTPTRHTCFPIYKDIKGYKALDARKVHGMRQDAKDAIDATEPYVGGKRGELWELHELDIADKHRTLLTAITCLGRASLTSFDGMFGRDRISDIIGAFSAPGFSKPLKTGDVFFTSQADKTQDMQFTFEIGFDEPSIGNVVPIIPYLDHFVGVVEGIIEDFKDLLL